MARVFEGLKVRALVGGQIGIFITDDDGKEKVSELEK